MFLPQDLTTAEQELVANVTNQMLARRSPSTESEETAVRDEAAQVAAEMIWEARRQSTTVDEYDDPELDEELEQSGYHQRLAQIRATNLAIQEKEDEETDQGL